jgi:hypothetical protein
MVNVTSYAQLPVFASPCFAMQRGMVAEVIGNKRTRREHAEFFLCANLPVTYRHRQDAGQNHS